MTKMRSQLIVFCLVVSSAAAQPIYFPEPGDQWQQRTPAQVGMDADALNQAIEFAKANESTEPRDLEEQHYYSFAKEPYGEHLGPFKARGDMTGIIVRHGYLVAEWGEPRRVDMTFSVSKSFLSTTVGLALTHDKIDDVHDLVGPYMPTDHFDSGLNSKITWDHLLRQTSDWQGTLFDKPDWSDRPPSNGDWKKYRDRVHNEPGTSYKYNDVRVNLLALAALHVWRRPLPQVLKEYVMDPIGASNKWRWHGYENSWITLDGLKMQSVSGGGHWGGGMWLTARDQARFGYLTLKRGNWNGKQLIDDGWFTMATTPTKVQRGYGFMNYFLNTDRQSIPSAPESAYSHRGAGTNMIYVDRENDLVVVARWIQGQSIDGFIKRVLASIK